MPSDVRLAASRRMLEAKGYFLERSAVASHFRRPEAGSFAVPVHHGKVKPIYVRKIEKALRRVRGWLGRSIVRST